MGYDVSEHTTQTVDFDFYDALLVVGFSDGNACPKQTLDKTEFASFGPIFRPRERQNYFLKNSKMPNPLFLCTDRSIHSHFHYEAVSRLKAAEGIMGCVLCGR